MLDKSASFLVALGLVLLLLILGGGIVALALWDKSIPDQLTQIATAALTGLLGLLGRSPNEGAPQNVYVQNPPPQV